MAKIIGDKLVNTEEDNRFVEEWLKKQPKVKIRNKRTGETFVVPLVTTSTQFDIQKEAEVLKINKWLAEHELQQTSI